MNKIAFIIGGSSGIGFSTIKILLNKGYTVINGSRRKCLDERVDNLYVDVTKPKTIKESIDYIIGNYSTVDLIIYNAGYSMAAPIEVVQKEDYQYLFEVNVFGIIETIKSIVPIMKDKGKGRIIIISSMGSVFPIPFDSFYSASKAAIDMLCLSLNIELSKFNISVTNVLPGGTKTNFTFKRKIYQVDEKLKYNSFNTAVNKLKEIEQNGMYSKNVAKTIYHVAISKNPPFLIASGIKNKISYFLSKIIPKKIIIKILKIKFKI